MPNQYVVPQFIEVEDKIIGPISVRQFVEIMVVCLIDFILFKALTFVTFLVLGIPLFLFTLVLAFAEINGQPFHLFLLNIIVTLKRPGQRVWYRDYVDSELREYIQKAPPPPPPAFTPKVRPEMSRLSELSLIVNTGGVYAGEEPVLPKELQ